MSKTAHRDIVLVVDDSPDTLRLLTDALEDAGMTVMVARDGRQALAIVGRITPDVILMDAVMPGLDGFETVRALKADSDLTHVPVIFLTGLADTQDVIKGLDAGGVDYVTKPIVPQELIARIRVHLANARRTRSARAALDLSGRALAALNAAGRLLWSTQEAGAMLKRAVPGFSPDDYEFSPQAVAWLAVQGAPTNAREEFVLGQLRLRYLATLGEDEFLLQVADSSSGDHAERLARGFGLTRREAEVLLWISRGKANRDIAEILHLSPRTVNKHLEQIFSKLGVENRTAAAGAAFKLLAAG